MGAEKSKIASALGEGGHANFARSNSFKFTTYRYYGSLL